MVDKKIIGLVMAHVFLLCLSNVLVQQPLIIAGWRSTWGAFSYPFIFILTDLSTRLEGAVFARKIVLLAMIPAFIVSFLFANWFDADSSALALRIALASFIAYASGQLMDILLFQSLRAYPQWWLAPVVATMVGNVVDTYVFFFVAFFHCKHAYLQTHWVEVANVDLLFKWVIGLGSIVPFYAWVLRSLAPHRRFTNS